MTEKSIKKGDNLSVFLVDMGKGDRLMVPYRFYSESSVRVTASRASVNGRRYSVTASAYKCTVERTE